MKGKTYVTRQGLQELKTEYEELVNIKRSEIAAKIEKARSLGDLSENAAYHQVRREQSFVEGRIAELEQILKNAKIIKNQKNGVVGLGSKVKVKFDDAEEEFLIVGEAEANQHPGKISDTSPLGKALIGRKVGDEVEVDAPAGKIIYKIIEIK